MTPSDERLAALLDLAEIEPPLSYRWQGRRFNEMLALPQPFEEASVELETRLLR